MAENSMSKVTITLGHSGQVVKKAGRGLDSSFGDSESTVGRKRSVRDRLGCSNDSTAPYHNKRLRASGSTMSLSASDGDDDTGLCQNDLRFKIMQKTMLKNSESSSQQSVLDLRDMLSRPAQSSTTVTGPRQHEPERKDSGQHFVESGDGMQRKSEKRDPRLYVAETRDSRQQMPEGKDARQAFVEPRDGRQRISELRDPRYHVAEVRECRLHMPEQNDARQHFVEPRDSSLSMSELRDPRLRVAEVMDGRHMGEVWDSRHMPEGKVARQHFVEPKDSRQYMPELRDPRLHVAEVSNRRQQHMPEGKDAGQHFLEPRSGRQYRHELGDPRLQMADVRNSGQHLAEVMDSRQHMLDWKDVRHHMPEPSSLSIMGRIPSTSPAGSSTHMDTMKSSYCQWALECLRKRSPDGVVITSRGFSPPRREEEVQRRPSVRSYDDIRVGSYMGKDVEFSRPRTSAPYVTMAALPAGPAKLMAPPLAPPMLPGSLVHRSPYPVDDQFTIESFLYSLGLEKYAINFKAEEVDMHALNQMGDSDLKDLGIPMGPRKKILLALQTRLRRQI